MYAFNAGRLRDVAAEHGDLNALAMAKSTGISVSSAYRIHSGATQPDLISALRISDAYGHEVRYFMDRVDAEVPAGATA